MYACICRGITECDVRRAGTGGAVTPESLIAVLGLDDAACCGRCADGIQPFVHLAWEGAELPQPFVHMGWEGAALTESTAS